MSSAEALGAPRGVCKEGVPRQQHHNRLRQGTAAGQLGLYGSRGLRWQGCPALHVGRPPRDAPAGAGTITVLTL